MLAKGKAPKVCSGFARRKPVRDIPEVAKQGPYRLTAGKDRHFSGHFTTPFRADGYGYAAIPSLTEVRGFLMEYL